MRPKPALQSRPSFGDTPAMQRRQALSAGLMTLALAAAAPALAQPAPANWPRHPIALVVPFPPGGLADIVARPVAEAMARELGQPVLVENRAGAGGGIGMGYVAKAKPDGYTILMALSSFTV